jgi:processive 1,2-diacylglycerol beta-glucosyltransferase
VIKKLIKYGIDTIISTHSFSSIITSKQNIKIKIKNNFAVITDIYAHSFWPKNLDMYFVPHYQTYKTLVENGVDSDRIDVCGMPLRKEFYLDYNTEKLKKKLKISSHPTFLITGGSKGIGDIIDVVKIFREIKTKSNVLVFCGSNKKLKKELSYMKYINNVKIYPLGYQKNPALYYAISDMIIGKSGGITIFEVASMKKVFTIYSPLPGQEERNAKFLLNHHSALNPSNPRSLKSIIESFLSNPHYFERYRVNISKLHRKDAPIKISNFIINSI